MPRSCIDTETIVFLEVSKLVNNTRENDKWRIRVLLCYWLGCHCSILWPKVSNKQDHKFLNCFKAIRVERELLPPPHPIPTNGQESSPRSVCHVIEKKKNYRDILEICQYKAWNRKQRKMAVLAEI